jgi:hypothetical protein
MLQKLSIEEASKYFEAKNVSDASYFTFKPSKKDPEWEDVVYYTSRKKYSHTERNDEYDSWVYVLSNPTQPGILKIGYTRNTPEERARQLSTSTGVALPYEVEFAYNCWNGIDLEKDVHERLHEYRISNQREFFQIDIDEARDIIEEIGKSYV